MITYPDKVVNGGATADGKWTSANANEVKTEVNAAISNVSGKVAKAGDTMSGALAMGSNKITGLAAASSNGDAVRFEQIPDITGKLNLSGGTMSGDIAMGSNKVTGLATPTNPGDAVNKSYADSISSGVVSAWKAPVRAATTANGTLATAYENGDTIDGITLATGDRILIKNQTTQTENGIYTVNASGAPTRATDADAGSELHGAAVAVQQGTANADTTWIQITDSVTVGSSNLVWTAIGTAAAPASSSTAGIAKLYTSTGSNTDGSMDQNSIKNLVFGVSSGVLGSPYQLPFDIYLRTYTISVTTDIGLDVAPSGKVAGTYTVITATGDLSHILSFPGTWVVEGDNWNPTKVHEITLKYTGQFVIVSIVALGDIPDVIPPTFTSAILNGPVAGTETVDLLFNEPVTITTAGWTVSASGGAVTVSSVVSGNGTNAPKFSLSRTISASETLTISYDPSTGNTLDASGNELTTLSAATVTNNAYTLNLSVPFTSTTVDATKGALTNPNSSDLTISQNNKLLFTRTTDNAVASVLTNYWRSVNTYTRGAFAVTGNRDVGFTTSAPCFMYRVDANNYIAFIGLNPNNWEIRVVIGNTTVYTANTSVSTTNKVRFTYSATNLITFQYWTGTAWTDIGSYTGNVGSAGNIQLSANSNVNDVQLDVYSFDDLYVTDKPYITLVP